MSDPMLPNKWRAGVFSDIADVNPAVAVAELCADAPVSFLTMADVSESGRILNHQIRPLCEVRAGFTRFEEDDVLFAKITPCMQNGKGAFARKLSNQHGFGSTEFHVLRATEIGDAEFIYHLAQSSEVRSKAVTFFTGSAGQQRVDSKFFSCFNLLIPPLPQQRKIARILTTLDNVITQTEALIAKYQAIKQGLMHDLLTYGMHEGRRQKTGVTPEGTPNRSLPVGWRIVSVAEIVSQARQGIMTGPFGAQLGTEDFIEEGVPVLRIGNVQSGYLNLGDLQYVSAQKAESLSRYRVIDGDLLFARSGATTGRNSLASKQVTGWLINYHIIRVAVDRQLCDPRFLFACFNAELLQRQVNQEKGKGTREGINTQAIAGFRFPLPTIAEQHAISDRLESVDVRISREQQYASKLRQLKTGLMQDLLTGKVPVKADEPEEAGKGGMKNGE